MDKFFLNSNKFHWSHHVSIVKNTDETPDFPYNLLWIQLIHSRGFVQNNNLNLFF